MNLSQQIIEELSQVRPGFANGYVIHNRRHPKAHRFRYDMCWCLIDLDDIAYWVKHSKLWQHNRFGVYSLYDKDYISQDKSPIKDKISTYLSVQSGQPFSGQVYLFTHPRFLGYGFNSVNFYFCYTHNKLRHIVSEITNTPWGEKHLYFHDCSAVRDTTEKINFKFDKQFHISPFVSMGIKYQWEFTVTPERIKVRMRLHKESVNVLNVVLDTKITPVMENNINRLRINKPFQPWKMALGIYWQAFKLWLKKVPFYSHPKKL